MTDSGAMAIQPLGSLTSGQAPIACATVAFRSRGQLRVAAIVKATFAFVQDRPMRAVDPEPIVWKDKAPPGSQSGVLRSVSAPSEVAPYLEHADVIFKGHATSFGGRPLTAFAVRLLIGRDRQTLIDKRLFAEGPKDRATGAPTPFARMPIVWELAVGGPDTEANPVGVPHGEANIFDMKRSAEPVGVGAIARAWPVRRKLFQGMSPRDLDQRIIELADSVPWIFFQCAPPDQRIEYLRGDEWVALEGMDRDLARVQSQLPNARAMVKLYGPSPALTRGRALPVVADFLSVDADAKRCSVIWRGNFPIGSEAELSTMTLYAGLDARAEGLAPGIPWPAGYEPPDQGQSTTVTADLAKEVQKLRAQSPLPFQAVSGQPQPARKPSVPNMGALPFRQDAAAAEVAAIAARAAALTGPSGPNDPERAATTGLPVDPRLVRSPLPFAQGVQSPLAQRPPSPPIKAIDRPLSGTVQLSPEEVAAIRGDLATPFQPRSDIEQTQPPQAGMRIVATPFDLAAKRAQAASPAQPPQPPPPAPPVVPAYVPAQVSAPIPAYRPLPPEYSPETPTTPQNETYGGAVAPLPFPQPAFQPAVAPPPPPPPIGGPLPDKPALAGPVPQPPPPVDAGAASESPGEKPKGPGSHFLSAISRKKRS